MAGAWYYADHQYCVVKTTVVRIYGSQQWCPDAPSVIRSYNIHEWNRLFPGYYCPPLSHCGQPPQTGGQPPAPAAPPATGGSTVTSGARGVTSGVAGPGEPGKVYTGPKPTPAEPGCAPAMAVVDEELSQGRFSGDGKTGVGEGGFGFSGVDQLAQPLVVGMTPLTVQGDNGRPSYTQEPRFDLRDELGHQTVHAYHEGTADGILCFHPPELIDYMLHGSGTNPNSRWPTNLSQATVLLHNCSRADASTGDVSITRLAFGNPLKGSVLPKSGQYLQYTASSGILNLVGTDANGASSKAHHLRVDVALDVPQYADSDLALLTNKRAGTIIWNTTDEVYQYWDGSAWVDFTTGSGSGDMLAANNLSDLASDDTSISNLVGGGTSRTPTETHDLPIRDPIGSNHGKASIAAIKQDVVTADNTLIQGIGQDKTDGPWKDERSKDFTTGGESATETLMDIPIPTNSQMQVTVEIVSVLAANAGRGTSYAAKVRCENNGGTCAVGTAAVYHNEADGASLTVSYSVSTTNLRISVADANAVMRVAAFVTRMWRTTSA